MKPFLHEEDKELFEDYIVAVSENKNIPSDAVRRDYFISLLLFNLSKSEFRDVCVFKGGTSLSKCYPGTIERFSEDIDLTYIDKEGKGNKTIAKVLSKIEIAISEGFEIKIEEIGRGKLSKPSYVWHKMYDESRPIKLEIGAKSQPLPIVEKTLCSYIHEYIIENPPEDEDVLEMYRFPEVKLKVLDITRTFIDKVYAVKTQAIVGSLAIKVRHLYDVVQLFKNEEVKLLLADNKRMIALIGHAKEASFEYINKRDIPEHESLFGNYNFSEWRIKCEKEDVQKAYESLHLELLYTDEKQSLQEALNVLAEIDEKINSISFSEDIAIK